MSSEPKLAGTVLYVEDDDTTRRALGGSLSRRVETLLLAQHGRQGLELFRQHAPDLVVTDIAMPVMSGLAMAREIKAESPQTQIVVTSAYSDTQFFLEAIELGIDGYVLKPVDFVKLFAAVRKGLALVDLERQASKQAQERERLLQELQTAANRIKTLSGLLPICSSCKKIRDDSGYWTQLERYFTEHSGVLFTHGLCPQCITRLYPDYADEPQGER
jgi:YesN/AraC family two-component response regulator